MDIQVDISSIGAGISRYTNEAPDDVFEYIDYVKWQFVETATEVIKSKYPDSSTTFRIDHADNANDKFLTERGGFRIAVDLGDIDDELDFYDLPFDIADEIIDREWDVTLAVEDRLHEVVSRDYALDYEAWQERENRQTLPHGLEDIQSDSDAVNAG